jgi:5-methyltetrahydropteroyltriglutamate--homocysteine methyltransferase
MKRSAERILTTHAGSLPRPPELFAMINRRVQHEPVDEAEFTERLRRSVNDMVTKQAECGIDIVTDGEQSKPSFADYVADRLNGLEGENPDPFFPNRRLDYPEFYAEQPAPGASSTARRPLCIGPLSWKDRDALQVDIENLKAAVASVNVEEAFMPAASPGIIAMRIPNVYYASEEEYLGALAEVLSEEYHAIVDAGLLLQIDAPDIPMAWTMQFGADRFDDYRRTLAMRNEALNYALAGIPEESVRYHVCWGNSESPHTFDIDLKAIVDLVLEIHAQAYSIEAANPRHAHEWELWRDVRLPEGKVLIPGVIDSTTNFVEHPELVAQRIVQYADLVGRENVIAGTDCGFGTAARLVYRVHPVVMWAKLRAMTDGAAIASQKLWK